MSEWRTARLEEVAQVLGGGTPSRQVTRYFGGHIAWATPTDVTALDQLHLVSTKETVTQEGLDNSSAKLIPPGAVLLTSRATIGYTAVAAVPVCTNQGFVNFVCGESLVPEFLAYWLRTQKEKMLQHAGGTTFKEIARGTLRKFEISFPSIDEQRRIVDLLSRAEGIVRLRRQAQQKAAALIPAIFVDMFGDPATNPKRWPELSMGTVVAEYRYGTSQKSGEHGCPTLRIPNVIGNSLDPGDMKLVDVPKAEADRIRLVDGDLLFVRTNGNPDYVGRSAVFEKSVLERAGFDGENCLYASYLIRARLDQQTVAPTFLQAFLSSAEGRKRIRAEARTSAGQYNINTQGLAAVVIPLPPRDLQASFVRRCQQYMSLAELQAAATKKAEESFQALLGRAFSASDQAPLSTVHEEALA